MSNLPPIPTPPAQRWRDFRVQTMPVLVFGAVLLTATVLWQHSVSLPSLVGAAESVTGYVSSPKPGLLVQMNTDRLQQVKAGDPIAQVITTDPKILASSLAVIQAEIELMRRNLQPVVGEQRYQMNYDKMQLDGLKTRADLATTRVKLQLAENEFRRTEELFRDKIVSERVFEQARATRDKLQIEVEETAKLVAQQEADFRALQLDSDGTTPGADKPASPRDVLRAAIAVQEEKLRLTEAELSPVIVYASLNGTVSVINHRAGEAVLAGEPILTLTSLNSTRIAAYVRQPLTVEPTVGMAVEVRTRSAKRQTSAATILQVGTQMEPITASLLPAVASHAVEQGLPIFVSLPLDIKLVPGEIVDLTLRPKVN